jgi:hypothetical protein
MSREGAVNGLPACRKLPVESSPSIKACATETYGSVNKCTFARFQMDAKRGRQVYLLSRR